MSDNAVSGLGRRLQLHGAEEGCSTVKVPVAGEERIDQSDLRRRKWNHESIIQGLPRLASVRASFRTLAVAFVRITKRPNSAAEADAARCVPRPGVICAFWYCAERRPRSLAAKRWADRRACERAAFWPQRGERAFVCSSEKALQTEIVSHASAETTPVAIHTMATWKVSAKVRQLPLASASGETRNATNRFLFAANQSKRLSVRLRSRPDASDETLRFLPRRPRRQRENTTPR